MIRKHIKCNISSSKDNQEESQQIDRHGLVILRRFTLQYYKPVIIDVGHEIMKPIGESPWKQRFLFFVLGALFSIICGFIQFKWMDIVPYQIFDQQPEWLKGLKRLVGWLPWMGFLAVLILRVIKGRNIRVGFYFLGTAAPTVILVGWLVFGDSVKSILYSQKFDAELWRNQEQVEHNTMWPPRLCMVDNLMSSGKLKGLTRSQVVQLLGPPHDKNFPGGAMNCDIHYYLGPERGFIRIDSEWLFITLGDNGKVNKYWIYRD